MKNKDWLIVKCPYSHNNPMIIRKSSIVCITPVESNQLQSFMYTDDNADAILVDEPTSTIEGYLCK